MPRAACLLVLLALVAAGAFPSGVRGQTKGSAEAGVFMLATVAGSNALAGVALRFVGVGTAFFVDPDGTALTNSHVVYAARQDPGRYQLLAIVGHEFYGASIVCASPLARDPREANARAVVARDVAEVRLAPSRFPFTRLVPRDKDITYTAHLGRLPAFPTLPLAPDPAPGEDVRIVGYGERLQGPATEQRAAAGKVTEIWTAPDDTPVFSIASSDRPRPGSSGSPVLDGQGRVVGMWTWAAVPSLAFGLAIAGSALTPACR